MFNKNQKRKTAGEIPNKADPFNMETSREEMCKSLNEWFTVFYHKNCISQDQQEKRYLNDLTDGVAMAIALKQLAPDYFTGKLNCASFCVCDFASAQRKEKTLCVWSINVKVKFINSINSFCFRNMFKIEN